MSITENFSSCYDMLSSMYEEVDGEDFYSFIFPDNENEGDTYQDFSHPSALYLYRDPADVGTKRRLRRRVMYKDTWSDDYVTYVEANEMTLCSGLAYRGKVNKLDNAQNMNALIFDIDGVGFRELQLMFKRMQFGGTQIRSIPKPTFIVLSGNGIHLYYVFDEPVALYPNIKLQMKALKYDLTFRIWEYKATSQIKSIQYQSISQGFRMVGSINTKYGNVVTAFRVGDKVTLDYMNSYADKPENRVDIARSFRPSKVSRDVAAKLYPEWYQRVVVEGNKRPKKWDIAGKVNGNNPYALYDWWKRQIGQVTGGHRYFFLMCLVIYACKCDVSKKKLEADMQEMFEELKTISHENPFTQEDVSSAMECYSKDYYNFTIDDIELLSGVRIEKNKRNGRKQADHIRLMNFVRDEINHNTNWRDGNGRPSKQMIVYDWQRTHPEGRKIDCIRETGLSKPTVLKWWDTVPKQLKVSVEETSVEDLQAVSSGIVADCQKIAAERGISEEEAYEIYKQNPKNPVITTKKSFVEEKSQYQLQREAETLIFSESEYLSLPRSVRRKLKQLGDSLRVVPDADYEVEMMKKFLKNKK